MAGKNLFKEQWTGKTHDVPIQEKLGEVMDMVHELDERLDTYETASGMKKADNEIIGYCKFCGFGVKATDRECPGCGRPLQIKKHTTNITQEISKPGPSIHTPKWDACVSEIGKNESVNAYAVCTARLGQESFKSNMTKSELEMAKSELQKAIDISSAGKIPNSLLSRQDLEKETTKAIKKIENIMYKGFKIEIHYLFTGEVLVFCLDDVFNNLNEAKQMIDRFILNKSVASTTKDLNETTKDAKEVDTETEKSDVIQNIKNIQLKRQKEIINERDTSAKSFKDGWNGLNKKEKEISDRIMNQYIQAEHDARYGKDREERDNARKIMRDIKSKYPNIENS